MLYSNWKLSCNHNITLLELIQAIILYILTVSSDDLLQVISSILSTWDFSHLKESPTLIVFYYKIMFQLSSESPSVESLFSSSFSSLACLSSSSSTFSNSYWITIDIYRIKLWRKKHVNSYLWFPERTDNQRRTLPASPLSSASSPIKILPKCISISLSLFYIITTWEGWRA